MRRTKRKRKRKNSAHGWPWYGVVIAGGVWVVLLLNASVCAMVVDKPMRPSVDLNAAQYEAMPPVDLKNLPDPFLSYLVRKVLQDSALREQENKKRREEQEKLAKMKAAAEEKLRQLRQPRTILQKLQLHQLLLTAIVESPEGEWAMVRDEKGMGYVLKKGTAIGTKGGRVAKISIAKKTVFIKEPFLENGIHLKYKTVVIELPDEVFN